MARKLLLLLVACFFCLGIIPVAGSNAAESEKVTVEAAGTGASKLEALKDAWAVAVRQAVGMYMNSRSDLKSDGLDDRYTEEIASYSRGQMDSFTILSESESNGIWTVKIKAKVDKDILQQTADAASRQKVSVDGANLAAQMQTSENKDTDAMAVIENSGLLDFSKCFDYSPQLIKQDLNGQPLLILRNSLKMNPAKFKKQEAELEKLVATLASGKRNAALDQNWMKKLLEIAQMPKYPLIFNPEFYERSKGRIDGIAYYVPYGSYYMNGQRPDEFANGSANDEGSVALRQLFANAGSIPVQQNSANVKEVCFFRNSASANCYSVSDAVFAKLKGQALFSLQFRAEKEGSFDSNLATSPLFAMSFLGTGDERLFLSPFIPLTISNAEYSVGVNDFSQCPAFIYDMFLNVPVSELVNLKDITSIFEVKPDSRLDSFMHSR